MNDLAFTVPWMNSDDYKDRFKAEYWQTKIRYDKLHRMTVKYEADTLDFTPVCPLPILKAQKSAMGQYLNILEIRAEMEGIDLSEPKENKLPVKPTAKKQKKGEAGLPLFYKK